MGIGYVGEMVTCCPASIYVYLYVYILCGNVGVNRRAARRRFIYMHIWYGHYGDSVVWHNMAILWVMVWLDTRARINVPPGVRKYPWLWIWYGHYGYSVVWYNMAILWFWLINGLVVVWLSFGHGYGFWLCGLIVKVLR